MMKNQNITSICDFVIEIHMYMHFLKRNVGL